MFRRYWYRTAKQRRCPQMPQLQARISSSRWTNDIPGHHGEFAIWTSRGVVPKSNQRCQGLSHQAQTDRATTLTKKRKERKKERKKEEKKKRKIKREGGAQRQPRSRHMSTITTQKKRKNNAPTTLDKLKPTTRSLVARAAKVTTMAALTRRQRMTASKSRKPM